MLEDTELVYGRRFLEKARDRGASAQEILATLEGGTDEPARSGRRARRRIFPFDSVWNGKYYHQKEVRVIYLQEPGGGTILVTVIVRYGSF